MREICVGGAGDGGGGLPDSEEGCGRSIDAGKEAGRQRHHALMGGKGAAARSRWPSGTAGKAMGMTSRWARRCLTLQGFTVLK